MYLDPSGGKAGASLETVYGAAVSGALKVDPQTGDATLKFLGDAKDMVEKMNRVARQVSVATPLGGGFGKEIGEFNQRLAAGGSNCAQELLTRFSQELDRLMAAVSMSMQSYQALDGANAHRLSKVAGAGR